MIRGLKRLASSHVTPRSMSSHKVARGNSTLSLDTIDQRVDRSNVVVIQAAILLEYATGGHRGIASRRCDSDSGNQRRACA